MIRTALIAAALVLASCQMPLRNAQALPVPEFNLAKWMAHEPFRHQINCLHASYDGMFGFIPLIECSWLGTTETEVKVLAEFAVKSRPGSWPAVFDIESVKVEPVEPVEPPGAQGRYTTKVYHDSGGDIDDYYDYWLKIRNDGGQVEVLDKCWSACTLVTALIPKDRLCFGEKASLSFHIARKTDDSPSRSATEWMIDKLPADIRNWINAKGGIEKMTIENYWWLPASELWKMGYRRCNG